MDSIIDWGIFSQLELMDEDEDGFSKSLISIFIQQFEETYTKIESGLQPTDGVDLESSENLNILSQYGHYLKGSAASLGLIKIQEQCEKIQNYGLKKDFDGGVANEDWIGSIKIALGKARIEFENARKVLSDYYKEEL